MSWSFLALKRPVPVTAAIFQNRKLFRDLRISALKQDLDACQKFPRKKVFEWDMETKMTLQQHVRKKQDLVPPLARQNPRSAGFSFVFFMMKLRILACLCSEPGSLSHPRRKTPRPEEPDVTTGCHRSD